MSGGNTLIRVLVADTAPTRLGVRIALSGVATICAEAGNHRQAVEMARAERPDVCLVGRALTGGGIRTVHEISDSVPGTAVIVLADNDHERDVVAAIRAGAIGYVPPGSDPAQLRRAVLAVDTEEPAIPRAMVRELVEEIRAAERADDGGLTTREAQVLAMLRRGEPTSAIADTLDISPVTVRRHISVLARKAGVSGREALLAAYSSPDRQHTA